MIWQPELNFSTAHFFNLVLFINHKPRKYRGVYG